jgi:hypothetical protein
MSSKLPNRGVYICWPKFESDKLFDRPLLINRAMRKCSHWTAPFKTIRINTSRLLLDAKTKWIHIC